MKKRTVRAWNVVPNLKPSRTSIFLLRYFYPRFLCRSFHFPSHFALPALGKFLPPSLSVYLPSWSFFFLFLSFVVPSHFVALSHLATLLLLPRFHLHIPLNFALPFSSLSSLSFLSFLSFFRSRLLRLLQRLLILSFLSGASLSHFVNLRLLFPEKFLMRAYTHHTHTHTCHIISFQICYNALINAFSQKFHLSLINK